MPDLPHALAHSGKLRRDWGTQNVIGLAHSSQQTRNDLAQRNVRQKIATFVQRAVYPQQLTIPRQYATTQEGVFIYKILEGRNIDGFVEQGCRVIVQENARQARFVMSPLFSSKHDALAWARRHMGAS